MSIKEIEQLFEKGIFNQVKIIKEDDNLYKVRSSYTEALGYNSSVFLLYDDPLWVLSDLGYNSIDLGFDIEEKYNLPEAKVTQQIIRKYNLCIEPVLEKYQVENRDGELVIYITDGDYAGALSRFCQALIEISKIDKSAYM